MLILPLDCEGFLWSLMLELHKYNHADNYSKALPIYILFCIRVAGYNINNLNVFTPLK